MVAGGSRGDRKNTDRKNTERTQTCGENYCFSQRPTIRKTANRFVMRDFLWVEIKVLQQDGLTEITDWIRENVSLIPWVIENDEQRLSGSYPRDRPILRYSPWQSFLFVSCTKNEITPQLPVMQTWLWRTVALVLSFKHFASTTALIEILLAFNIFGQETIFS